MAVAGYAIEIINDSFSLANQPIKSSGFTHIGPPHNGYYRKHFIKILSKFWR
jgi:hypothetical protein